MPTLSIKDVPEQWTEALRQRAALNHRSLQGELMAIVEQAVGLPHPAGALAQPAPAEQDGSRPARVVGYDRSGHPIVRQGWKTVEQVIADLHAKYPSAIDSGPSSIDIVRQDRDAR